MSKEVIAKVQQVFREVFRDEELVIDLKHAANDIPGWDSLTHMTLIAELEAAFAIAFTFDEVSSFKNVNDLVQLISIKIN